jgi:hypothetical protein
MVSLVSSERVYMKNFSFIFLVLFLLQCANCESLKKWLAQSGYKCPENCRILPEYSNFSCSACYSQNLEGEWDLEVIIPGKKTISGSARVCCGEISLGGELGIGAEDCVLTGDACSFRVTCGLSSITGCPPGNVLLEGKADGDTIKGTAQGCNMTGSLWGDRYTIAPCNQPPPEKDAVSDNKIY